MKKVGIQLPRQANPEAVEIRYSLELEALSPIAEIIEVDASTPEEFAEGVKDMDAIYLKDIGYIIAIIDEESIQFIKVSNFDAESEWKTIGITDYTHNDWILKAEIPTNIRITQDGKHSIVITDKGTMLIYMLMI